MKLVANKTRENKGVEYFKYLVVIPNKDIKELNWEKGEELETEVKNGEVVIRKK